MMRYSSSRIQQDTRLVSVDYLINMVEIGRLDPKPAVGSLPNWRMAKRSHIVESLILGLPVEMIWSEQNPIGKIQLLSGFEVIANIIDFKNDKFRLQQTRILKHLEGLRFSEIDFVEQKLFVQMEVAFGTIHYDSDPILKCLFVENIHKDKYTSDASQIARIITFKNAFEFLDRYVNNIFDKFNDTRHLPKRLLERYKLKLQTEILVCLLVIFISDKREHLNVSVGMESYSYSRSHISHYSNYNDVNINSYDDIEIALHKIMFMLEVNESRLDQDCLILDKLIQDAFDHHHLKISTIGKCFLNNLHVKNDDLSLFDYVISSIFSGSRKIRINRFSSVNDLMGKLIK